MEPETIAEYLKSYHAGEAHAVTSREMEIAFGIKGKELRDRVNMLRRGGIPICSNGNGYFYAATAQEVRATIAHMSHRIAGISAAIYGLNRALEEFDTGQARLPLDGAGGVP